MITMILSGSKPQIRSQCEESAFEYMTYKPLVLLAPKYYRQKTKEKVTNNGGPVVLAIFLSIVRSYYLLKTKLNMCNFALLLCLFLQKTQKIKDQIR